MCLTQSEFTCSGRASLSESYSSRKPVKNNSHKLEKKKKSALENVDTVLALAQLWVRR